jgi:hypothetical protein
MTVVAETTLDLARLERRELEQRLESVEAHNQRLVDLHAEALDALAVALRQRDWAWWRGLASGVLACVAAALVGMWLA